MALPLEETEDSSDEDLKMFLILWKAILRLIVEEMLFLICLFFKPQHLNKLPFDNRDKLLFSVIPT